jgi:hypothetical protein
VASKKKGKGHAPKGGKYAQIPVALAKEVLGKLSAPEFRVWMALCLQCQHWCNGTGKLCRSVIKEFHLGSQRVVTAATKQLIDAKHVVRTRDPKQRKCALYGITHLSLNTDEMAKEGLSDGDIRAALTRFGKAVSDSNSGSANSATKKEALNDEIDNRGSAKHSEPPLALPKSRGYASKSTSLALPQGNTSKNLPSVDHILSSASVSPPVPDSLPNPLSHARAPSKKNGGADSKKDDERIRKARKHLTADPLADNAILVRMYGLSVADLQQLRTPA